MSGGPRPEVERGRKPRSELGGRGFGLGGLARLRQLVLIAVIAGVAAGLLLTGLQRIAVVPIILEAESYESAAGAPAHSHGDEAVGANIAASTHAHDHDHAAGAAPTHANDGESAIAASDVGVMEEDGGAGRFWLTLLANLVSAAGFGLLLAAGMSLVAATGKRIGWRKGLLWGLAGFGAFQLAPALGLPPEIPGAAATELAARQGWWIMTAALTALGLGWLAFAPKPWMKALALVPLALPHLIGAPAPEHHGGLAPEALATQFVYATLITNGLFWLALGGLAGFVHSRFERREAARD